MHVIRPWDGRWRSSLAALAVFTMPVMVQAQKATISGHVTTVGTGQPVAYGQVFVVGTTIGTSTDGQGGYVIPNAPTGTVQVRVLRVGYEEQKQTVTVAAGQQVTLDFQLKTVAVQLQPVVTTATGNQRRVELGNSVANLGNISNKVETEPVHDVTDLMVAKAPGVTVLPGNMTGSAPTIRIRGLSSISLSNAPIYVVDGVRINAGSIGLGTGGTTASYLNTLNPEEIANIEIVKGPAAATLYGTDAVNGVVVITTKTGQAGAPRWDFHVLGGLVQDRNEYPTQYAVWGHDPANPSKIKRCVLVTMADNSCAADSTTSLNIFDAPDLTPLANGNQKQYGVQVSGGTAAVRYFVSGDLESEIGPVEMPGFGIQFFDSLKTPVKDEWKRPEAFQRNSFRANLNMSLSPKFDLAVATSFGQTNQRLPGVDNNTFSYLYNAFSNPGFRGPGLGFSNVGGLGEDLHSYRFYTPTQLFQYLRQNVINRYIGSISANWRPFNWMQNSATVGLDFADQATTQECRFAECPASGDTREGFVFNSRTNSRNFTAQLNSTSEWQINQTFNSKTTLGLNYTNEGDEFASAEGDHLPPGGQGAGQGAIQSAGSSFLQADKTLGFYAQELVTINDKIFITGGVRTDQNSAFGTNFQRVFYPKAQVSWLLSDESFFPHMSWLNQFRLRGAFGASGRQPGATDALITYRGSTTNIATLPSDVLGADTPGLLASGMGNPDLKPETSKEWEGGFESQLLNNRVSVDFTYYYRKTQNALIDQQIAASSGASDLTVLRNLGSTQNKGIEASINATILDMPNFEWDITVGGSHNSNKVLSLGVDAQGNPNPTIGQGGERRDSVGLPINAWFLQGFTYSDANGDGIIGKDEVQVDQDFHYAGYSIAPDIASITSGVTLLNKKLRLSALLDYKGGFLLSNDTKGFYCQQTNQCYDETHTNASLYDQARLVAERYGDGTNQTDAGYFEDGSFWRLREVSANFTFPQKWSQAIHAHNASVTFSARNLHVWTKYTGTDPESNYGTDDVQTDFSTTAPPTYFTLRLNLHY